MGTFDDLIKPKTGATNSTAPSVPFVVPPVARPPAPAPAHAPPAPASRPPANRFAGRALQAYQPVLQTEANSVWTRIDRALAAMYAAMEDACADLGVEAYVARSNAFEYPFAVRFECWIQAPGDKYFTERVVAHISVLPKAWHRFEMEYVVTIENRGRKKVLGHFGEMRDQDVHALLSHLVRGTPEPRLYPRLRQPGDPFWRWFTSIKNRPTSLRRDWAGMVSAALVTAGVLGMAGVAGNPALGALGFVLFVSGTIWAYFIARQPIAVRNAGRPPWQPRVLRVYDSWQAVVPGAGQSAETFRARFLAVLGAPPVEGFESGTERIGYRMLDQVVHRDQIVLTAKRGVIYCQVYQFGTDLYVGWESFLNQGRWVEQVGAHGRDAMTGRRAEVRAIVPGHESLCEYDYADVNCLTQWTHLHMSRLTKQVMKEHQIDEEIDFQIVRADRQRVSQPATAGGTQETPGGAGGEKKPKGFFRRKG